jgi:RND family efflux transporter MFP subunit
MSDFNQPPTANAGRPEGRAPRDAAAVLPPMNPAAPPEVLPEVHPEAHPGPHGPLHGGPSQPGPPPHPISGRTALVVILVLALVAVAVAIYGILSRRHARTALAAETNALAIPDVIAISPKPGSPQSEVVLPGNMFAYEDSPIYARTSGYLERWYYDIGAHVKKGQLLATISSPEVDQQLFQAKADLATAESNAGYAKATAQRYQGLLSSDAVTAQDTENFTTQAKSTSSAVQSAQANMHRLQELQSFEKIYAPFNGVVTARGIDIGQLIDQGTTTELFHLSSTDVLRVYINVPQVYSRDAITGTKANLTFSEYPGRTFQGTLVRNAKAIDPTSRTLLVEVDVDNRKGELVPGAYTEVHMKVNRYAPTLVLPVSTLLFRQEGLRVATVQHQGDRDIARLVPIILGHDDGETVQVVNGLDPDAKVIQNPPDSVVDGEPVHIVQPQGAQPAQPQRGQ